VPVVAVLCVCCCCHPNCKLQLTIANSNHASQDDGNSVPAPSPKQSTAYSCPSFAPQTLTCKCLGEVQQRTGQAVQQLQQAVGAGWGAMLAMLTCLKWLLMLPLQLLLLSYKTHGQPRWRDRPSEPAVLSSVRTVIAAALQKVGKNGCTAACPLSYSYVMTVNENLVRVPVHRY
jgi:hypothetical protein